MRLNLPRPSALWLLLLPLSALTWLSITARPTGPENTAAPAAPRALPAPASRPRIGIGTPTHHLHRGRANQVTVTGEIGVGERVYLAGSTFGSGNGPCFAGAGGLCLGLLGPRNLLGSAVVERAGHVVIDVTPPGLPQGTALWLQAVVVRRAGVPRGAESIASSVRRLTLVAGPIEGSVPGD